MEQVILSSTKVDTVTISLIKDVNGFIVRQDVPVVTVAVLQGAPVGGVKDYPFPDVDSAWTAYTQRIERCLKISRVLVINSTL